VKEISVDQIRSVVLSKASYPPHEGQARVFVVRAADQLSISAANALLKTLEEPRPDNFFVLLSARPQRLLSTIRSRTTAVRFGPLPNDALREILRARGVSEQQLPAALELAAGSAKAALAATDDQACSDREQFVAAVAAAVRGRDLGPAVAFAESYDGDRQQLRADLMALASRFAQQVRSRVKESTDQAELAAERYSHVIRAVENLDRNASPNLTLSTLVSRLRQVA